MEKKIVRIIWRLPIGDKVTEVRNYVDDYELDQYIEDTSCLYGWVMDEVYFI